MIAMQKELNQLTCNDVSELVAQPSNHPIIGTKCVFKNKFTDQGKIIRNKAHLAAKSYNQVERINFNETFAPVARLEVIRHLLAYSSINDFKLFQIISNYCFINDKVYVEQPQVHKFRFSKLCISSKKGFAQFKTSP
ncbi:putative mitochondrial protein [Apostasia shenzhenica]|uniref:Putative mitochondrial protein n=1 Tax=Apostasia shenzhenica TaxID=1088818 RepID=A0A2I0ACZ5_9ASPA|nr:putative mitochondrial protein [Apostasia shenzhenica]